MERKFPGKKVSKIWVYLVRLSSFLEILGKAVPFATGSCRKFKPDILVEWKALFIFNSRVSLSPCSLPAPGFSSILKATLTNGEFKLNNYIVL